MTNQDDLQYMHMAAATLVVYDAFLTLDEELLLVWGRPWTRSMPLYLISRYGIPVHASLAVMYRNWPGFGWTTLAMLAITEALLTLRVCALYLHRKSVTIPIVLLYLFTTLGMVCLEGASQYINQGEDGITPDIYASSELSCRSVEIWIAKCIEVAGPYSRAGFSASWDTICSQRVLQLSCYLQGSFPGLIFVPGFILESALFILTIVRTVQHARERVNTPILAVLVKDGLLYFAVVFLVILINIIFSVVAPIIFQSFLSEMAICLSSTIATRMLLKIRRTLSRPEISTVNITTDAPRERFAVSVGTRVTVQLWNTARNASDYDSWVTSASAQSPP